MTNENVLDRVRQVAKDAGAKVLNAVPSPEDCGCGRRKRAMQENLRSGKSLGDIIGDLVGDLRGKDAPKD